MGGGWRCGLNELGCATEARGSALRGFVVKEARAPRWDAGCGDGQASIAKELAGAWWWGIACKRKRLRGARVRDEVCVALGVDG